MPDLKELNEKIEAVETDAKALIAKIEAAPDSAAADQLKADFKSLTDSIAPLLADRDAAAKQAEFDGMKAQVTTLGKTIEEMRSLNVDAGAKSQLPSDSPYVDSENSIYRDLAAQAHDAKAQERLNDHKAMTEGTNSAGGYLVQTVINPDLIALRVADTAVRLLTPSLAVNTNQMTFVQQTGGLTAGWTAELATKPSADMTFAEFNVGIYTIAGLSYVSNQLLQDAGNQGFGPAVGIDTLITQELQRRVKIVEEIAVINGSGVGQPLGLLQTTGLNTAINPGSNAYSAIPNAIVDAITSVQQNFFGNPNAIVMHPRTWGGLMKLQETASPTTYIIGPPGGYGRRPSDPLPGNAIPGTEAGTLNGYPVFLSANIPITLSGGSGTGGTESAILVGDFSQALFLDRQGFTVDVSQHVGFTTNQTVFRGESRVGYTAARYPKAFTLIKGANMAGL